MMGHREKLAGGMEYDVLYGKHRYCVFNKPRVAHGIKKQMARRARRIAKKRLDKTEGSA